MQKRVEWIDTARGIGIFLVIIGHAVTTVIRNDSELAMAIYKAVYFVQIPLLFFVSGLVFDLSFQKYKNQKLNNYFESKVRRLLVPYAVYSLIVYLIFCFANLIPATSRILTRIGYGKIGIRKWIFELISGRNIYSHHLWYIYSLFLISLLAFILLRLFDRYYRYVLLIVTIVLWFFFSTPTEYDVVWLTSMKAIWFALGCLFGIKNSFTKFQIILIIFGIIVFGPIYWIIYSKVPYDFLRFIQVILIMFIVLALILLAQTIEVIGGKFFSFLGKNSFAIYLFHQPWCGSGLGVVLYKVLHMPIFICVVTAIIASVVFPMVVDRILRYPKVRMIRVFLLGEQ